MWQHLTALLVVAVGTGGSLTCASAADFTLQPADAYGPTAILIQGEIKAGDFERFQAFLLNPKHLQAYANYVWLDSRGGDLPEAMKIANLLEKSSASVVVGPDGKCYSACFMLFAAGADRWLYPFGELGVHQIAVSASAGAGGPQLDRLQTQAIALAVTNDVRVYLTRHGIPAPLIQRLMDTPHTDLYKIDTLMLKRFNWQRGLASRPDFLAAVQTVCGPQPGAELPSPRQPSSWTACKINYQVKRTKRFVANELAQIEAGQPSVLFAPGTVNEARRAVAELE